MMWARRQWSRRRQEAWRWRSRVVYSSFSSSSSIPREKVDCVVVGAGVVGLAVARALSMPTPMQRGWGRRRRRSREVLVLEAASDIATGTSSRNSEVIHAGIYYPQSSLKVCSIQTIGVPNAPLLRKQRRRTYVCSLMQCIASFCIVLYVIKLHVFSILYVYMTIFFVCNMLASQAKNHTYACMHIPCSIYPFAFNLCIAYELHVLNLCTRPCSMSTKCCVFTGPAVC